MPLPHTLSQLASLARLRGDTVQERLLRQAERVLRAHHIEADAGLRAMIEHPPADVDADVLGLLRQIVESGAQGGGEFETVERAVAAALPNLRHAVPRIPLGRALGLAHPVLSHLRSLPDVEWALAVGSLRRGQDTVGDIELLAAARNPATVIEAISQAPNVERVLHKSARRLYVLIDHTQIGLRISAPSHAGSTLLHLTGSAAHCHALGRRASERGWQLTSVGLQAPGGLLRAAASEEEIYAALDLPFIPPEIRNGDDEIAAAERGTLPALLTGDDIRGDFHMHSVWSDGRDSIETMVRACRDLGYEYIAITDHSPASGTARSLSVQTVKRQADEIAAVRERVSGITILHGCEVDILPKGHLDFPDRVLEQFDIVLASLHHGGGDGRAQLLHRYQTAMRHPLVTLVTHPTNRMVPHRAGYDLDYDRLFEAAVETGTLLEIDGAPGHLDMDGALARRAIAAGVTVAVDSDCHRADLLGTQMDLGVLTARRGWVEARHVLNTRPLADVRALIARKRVP